MREVLCDHCFVLLDTVLRTEAGGYNTHYIRIDTFFCERCLGYKSVTREDWSRERPVWWNEAMQRRMP